MSGCCCASITFSKSFADFIRPLTRLLAGPPLGDDCRKAVREGAAS
jgi:hypothetical protein